MCHRVAGYSLQPIISRGTHHFSLVDWLLSKDISQTKLAKVKSAIFNLYITSISTIMATLITSPFREAMGKEAN